MRQAHDERETVWLGGALLLALLPVLVHAGSSPTERIAQHCEPFIGEPRVLQVTPRVKVAIGYEIANVILIQTDEGVVVVDAGLSPTGPA